VTKGRKRNSKRRSEGEHPMVATTLEVLSRGMAPFLMVDHSISIVLPKLRCCEEALEYQIPF
jgi:hypothetical protein